MLDFGHYLRNRTYSTVLDTKVILLSLGLDVDFASFQQNAPRLSERYRTVAYRAAVSDRAHIDPKSPNRVFIPDELLLSEQGENPSVVKVYYTPTSPLKLVANSSENNFLIVEKDTLESFPVDVKPIGTPAYARNKFEDGTPFDKYITMVGIDRVSLIPYDGCNYWIESEPCSFCGGNPKRLGFDQAKPNLIQAMTDFRGDYRAWWNAYRERMRERVAKSMHALLMGDVPSPHFHFMITGGNLPDLDLEWQIAFDLLDALNTFVHFDGIDSSASIMPPNDLSLIRVPKEKYHFKGVGFNLEVWGEEDFRAVCPGKELHYGWGKMLRALEYAVPILGVGNVRSNFVLGAQELEKTLIGVKTLAQRGIVADYSVFFPRPGSKWSNKSALSPNDVLEFAFSVDKVYREFGFEPVYCRLSSRSSIANEIHALK